MGISLLLFLAALFHPLEECISQKFPLVQLLTLAKEEHRSGGYPFQGSQGLLYEHILWPFTRSAHMAWHFPV